MLDYDFDLIDRLIDRELSNSVSTVPPINTIREGESVLGNSVTSRHIPERKSSGRDSMDAGPSKRDEADRGRSVGKDHMNKLEQSKREDCSVMVMGLHPESGDREVYEFFSKEAGKVRDVHVIRDQRTGKSKGVAYVEFYLQEAVIKALACNGRTIHGALIRVKASGAEKNRAAEAQKVAQTQQQDKPVMLYLMGLSGPLTHMTDTELREILSPFGKIDYVSIGRCPYSGKSRGFAYVQFLRAVDAREAMACMNGFQLAGQSIQIGYLTRSLESGGSTPITEGDFIRSNEHRVHLMETLRDRL